MATYGTSRSTLLVRNHEQDTSTDFPALAGAELTYDPVSLGGTSTVEIDKREGKADEYISLAGTNNNCAGGATWLTCEETTDRAGDADGHTKDHGFVFEVHPSDRSFNVDPTPLTVLGRFAHDAAAVDPRAGIVYLTENASGPNGLLCRHLPNQPRGSYGSLPAGGALEAMRCTDGGTVVPDLSAYSAPGTTVTLGWVAVPDPLATTVSTRTQLPEVTRSRKFGGAWWGRPVGVHRLLLRPQQRRLGRRARRPGVAHRPAGRHPHPRRALPAQRRLWQRHPDGPDNITVSPWGGLILAEDGEGVQLLQAVTPAGATVPFARNPRDDGEFTGVCFSGDRQTLYANLQRPGMMFAITGPCQQLRRS